VICAKMPPPKQRWKPPPSASAPWIFLSIAQVRQSAAISSRFPMMIGRMAMR
jgi:hypothetical protein